ncbi:MAG: hypothetical protein ACJ0OB_05650 [Flavobacteriaceae bacterium]|tara:strand:- start:185 stop:370 length:186 start_codon:yes stop_codon:yes gene_type:complete
MKIRRISEIFYLIIFFIASIDYFFGENDDGKKKILLMFSLVSLFMFLFRRFYRKKFDNRNK